MAPNRPHGLTKKVDESEIGSADEAGVVAHKICSLVERVDTEILPICASSCTLREAGLPIVLSSIVTRWYLGDNLTSIPAFGALLNDLLMTAALQVWRE